MSQHSRSKNSRPRQRSKRTAGAADDVMRFNDISQLPVSPRFGGHQTQFLYCGVLAKKWWRNYLHMHSFFEICHVFDGNGTFLINDKQHDIGPGDTLIAKPREAHEIISSRQHPLGLYFWAFTLTPNEDRSSPRGTDALYKLMESFWASSKPIVRVEGLEQVLRLMTQEVAHASPGYLEMINNLAAKAIVDTIRAAASLPSDAMPQGKTGGPSRSFAETVVQTAIQYLSDNLNRRFEVRDVAAQVNLSDRQLRRVFRQHAGGSILAYLTDLRIERSAQLLLATNMPIKQIAVMVGYPDTHYFTTLFGRLKGITPAAFRHAQGTEFLQGPRKPRPRRRKAT